MTQRSLFKEVAQRIVERAQFSENDSAQPHLSRMPPVPGSSTAQSVQMTGSTFVLSDCLTSPTDTSQAPHR